MNEKEYKYMVCTRCFTYNHAMFVESALEGFAMQQAGFPMVFVIIDDASTDGEREILKNWATNNLSFDEDGYAYRKELNYGELLFARHRVNRSASFAFILLNTNHYSQHKSRVPYTLDWWSDAKYLAECEGDDYWINPNKLQIQVDFLESHPNNSGCIHAYKRDAYQGNDISSTEIHKYNETIEAIPVEEVICGKRQFCATASWVYRASAVDNYPEWAMNAPVGDRPLKLVLFSRGDIGYINEVMSVYRVGVPGSWTRRILKNRKKEKKLREGLIGIMKDFDEWTEKKYHKYVKRNIVYSRYIYWKSDYIIRPYVFIKRLFHL